MFEATSLEVYDYFKNALEFNAIFNENIFPVIAPESATFPFACYLIDQSEEETKDIDVFNCIVFLWFDVEKYTDCVKAIDVCTGLVKNNPNWDYGNSTIQFIEENYSFCGIINFKKY